MDRKIIKLRDNVLGDVSSRQYLKTPYLVFAVAILLTIGVTYFFYKSVENRDRSRFSTDTTKIKATLESRVNSYISLLKAGRGFFESNRSEGAKGANRESFARFVRSLELEKDFEGTQGVGFLKRVRPDEREALVERMKGEGFKDFFIFPEQSAQSEANVLIYLEPINKDSNPGAIGFAMSSDPAKLNAMNRARDTGEPAVSERVILNSNPKNPAESVRRPGFQIFVPLYATDDVPATAADRENLLQGYVFSAFRANNFIADVKKISSVTDISFAIYDQQIDTDHLLAESTPPEEKSENVNKSIGQSLSQTAYDSIHFEYVDAITVGNENWVVKYQTLPSFHSNSSTGWTLIIFFFGLGISLLLFFITLSQSKAHSSIELIAKDLARSEKVKDEFIAVVSHELRTPLNSIAGGVTILRNHNVKEETRLKALDIIEKNLRSQVNLVEDMIVFSDINAGKEYMQLKTMDFSAFVDKFFDEYLPLTQAKSINFKKQDDLSGQLIAADETKLEKALRNILSNAVKFTPPGGEIMIVLTAAADHAKLSVTDNGFGIHPQVMPYVFDLFKQGDSSTVRRHGGLGLGMALSKHIVNLHGGTLEAFSEGVDKGSTFTIKIPIFNGELSN